MRHPIAGGVHGCSRSLLAPPQHSPTYLPMLRKPYDSSCPSPARDGRLTPSATMSLLPHPRARAPLAAGSSGEPRARRSCARCKRPMVRQS